MAGRSENPPAPAPAPASPAGSDAADNPAPAPPPPTTSRLVVWLRRIGIALVALLFAAIVGVVMVIRHYEAGLPSVDELRRYTPPQVTRVLTRDGQLLGEMFTERRTVVRFEDVPNQMKLAALAAEDASFYEHKGLDYPGMLRALWTNLRGGKRQGASTITQQIIKNILLTPERTFDRKMREAILARRIEGELKKDEILELYLNYIYLGHGRYGVEEASRFYFGKSVREVTLAEAALLAGIIQGPNLFSPRVDMKRALRRRAYVLDQMEKKGFASATQVEAARREPVTLAPEAEVLSELAPEVVSEVKRSLRALLGPAVDRGGYTVTTTIDPALEAAARAAVRRNADAYAKRHKRLAPLVKAKREPAPFQGTPTNNRVYQGVVIGADDAANTLEVRVGTITGTVDLRDAGRYNPDKLPASKFAEVGKVVPVRLLSTLPDDKDLATAKAPPRVKLRLELGPEGALVAIDVRTREILALVGSYAATPGGLDRASHARRQPGSTFKTFVYSYALHTRTMTPASIVETSTAALADYKPDNYDESEGKAPNRMRPALADSVNVSAVWTLKRVGATNVAAWAQALGVESKLGATPSLALGAYEVTPREMATAYASLAAGGVYEAPILIKKIVGPNGVEIPLPERPPARRVMDEAEAYVTTSLLTSVVRDGTGKRAKALGRPIAGKTGTSNDVKDAWFVGYSTDITCAVWTGFDFPTPLGAGEAGASAALPAFVDFMREAHKGRPAADFPVPSGIVHIKIDPASGLRAYPDQEDAIDEVFLAGTEPSETAKPDAGAPDEDGGDETGAVAAPTPDAGTLVPVLGPGDPPPLDEPPPF